MLESPSAGVPECCSPQVLESLSAGVPEAGVPECWILANITPAGAAVINLYMLDQAAAVIYTRPGCCYIY